MSFSPSAIVQIRIPEPRSANSSTTRHRGQHWLVDAFLELEAGRQVVDGRYDGDCNFFTICSMGLGMKAVAH